MGMHGAIGPWIRLELLTIGVSLEQAVGWNVLVSSVFP